MYTTHGYMQQGDYLDFLADTDQGTTDVHLDNPPDWFEIPAECPICTVPVAYHDAFRVTDAGGTIVACLVDEWHYAGEQ